MEKDSIFYIYRVLEQKLLIIFGNTIYYTNLPVKTRNWLKTIKIVWIIWNIINFVTDEIECLGIIGGNN